MELRARLAGASALALAVLAPAPAAAQAYRNPDLPVDQRAADLVRRMTITEKDEQMQNGATGIERLGVLHYAYLNEAQQDRKSVECGKRVSVGVDLGGRCIFKTNKKYTTNNNGHRHS